ncbi:MAG: hypothetical protein KDB14_20850 [Planctomycetales bacterium]|nr:hypothetical protein [Planctomycetales bacterium]
MRTSQRRSKRRGALLLATIICVMLASTVAASAIQRCLRHRRESQLRQWQVQAAWLAHAGLERAAANLQRDDQYQGETWTMVINNQPARVTISRDGSVLEVTADYPDDPHHRARERRECNLGRKEKLSHAKTQRRKEKNKFL